MPIVLLYLIVLCVSYLFLSRKRGFDVGLLISHHMTIMSNLTCITWVLLELSLELLVFECWNKEFYHQVTLLCGPYVIYFFSFQQQYSCYLDGQEW